MLSLFDDNNFEKEFVDTTNDHDTLPLDESNSSSFDADTSSSPDDASKTSADTVGGSPPAAGGEVIEESVTE